MDGWMAGLDGIDAWMDEWMDARQGNPVRTPARATLAGAMDGWMDGSTKKRKTITSRDADFTSGDFVE